MPAPSYVLFGLTATFLLRWLPLATVEWKRAKFALSPDPGAHVWLPGDDIQMGIGQGFVSVTPIQMAVAYAAIANGGSIVTPTPCLTNSTER